MRSLTGCLTFSALSTVFDRELCTEIMENSTDSNRNVISREAALAFIASVTPEKVRSVYSGRNGCACGCRGNHRYHPEHVAEASKDRGSRPMTRSISIVLNKVKRASNAVVLDGNILSFEDDSRDRLYIVYLTNGSG